MSQPQMILISRSFSSVGAFGAGASSQLMGGAVTAITDANPTVLSATTAHGLIANDPVQVAGVTTDTAANGNFAVASVSGLTLTYPAIGNGVAGFAAANCSFAFPISGIVTDWTLRMRCESLTAGKRISMVIEDSVDGFNLDIEPRATAELRGQIQTGGYVDCLAARIADLPQLRCGTALATLRVRCVSIDNGATGIFTCWIDA